MIVGFNHNFRYKGELYHVQTEDGGLKSPNIVTLLYRGGTILASQKTSYADIAKVDNLEQVVEDLMKEQHKEMLRRLKDGEFDDRLKEHQSIVNPAVEPAGPAPQTARTRPPTEGGEPPRSSEPDAETGPLGPGSSAQAQKPVRQPTPAAVPAPAADSKPVPSAPAEPEKDPGGELGLDDIILSYLVGDEDK